MPPSAQEVAMQQFKRQHLEDAGHPGVPKPDKIVEWSLMGILEMLWSINTHLARIAARPPLQP